MSPARRPIWLSWTRWAGAGVSVFLLILVFRIIDGPPLVQALSRFSPQWLVLSLLLYGLALGVAAARWHLALRHFNRHVHFGASLRSVFVGHFFSSLWSGSARWDSARSILYARRHRFPARQILAAASLDRGLAALGIALVLAVALLAGRWTGAFTQETGWAFELSPDRPWILMTLALSASLGLMHFVSSRRRGLGPGRGRNTLRGAAKRWAAEPQVGWKTLAVTLMHPIISSAVFALCLQTVSLDPLPWTSLLWTAPAVTLLSRFPIAVAGAGIREMAALAILGWYQVPAPDAVAAAMGTLAVHLSWSAVGGWVLGRESSRPAQGRRQPLPRTISVVIPAFNEESSLPQTLRHLQAIPEIREILVVDGGSQDRTCEVAAGFGCRVLHGPAGRGAQLRLGASQATAEVVLLLHADTWLPADAGQAALGCLRDASVVGGGFWKIFQDCPWMLWGSRLKCAVRLWLYRRIAGDQAMFVRRSVLEEVGGVPGLPLMEEFALCELLRTKGRLALAGATLTTSARRFVKFGVLRTCLLMAIIHLRYRLGTSPEKLRRIYDHF